MLSQVRQFQNVPVFLRTTMRTEDRLRSSEPARNASGISALKRRNAPAAPGHDHGFTGHYGLEHVFAALRVLVPRLFPNRTPMTSVGYIPADVDVVWIPIPIGHFWLL